MNGKMMTACGDTRRRLKSFFEDLLSDEEYRDFVVHLEACRECEKYIRSIGDLSNHIWQLGQVSVPADFHESVLFKLRQVDPPPVLAKKNTLKKWAIAAIIVVLVSLAGFLINRRFFPPAANEVVPATAEVIENELSEDALIIETRVRPESAQTVIQKPSLPASSAILSPGNETPARAEAAVPQKVRHWHVIYSKESQNVLLQQRRQEKARLLNEQAARLKTLKGQIGLTEDEAAAARIEESARDIESEMNEIEESEIEFKRELEEMKKKEISSKSQLADLINGSGARMISQPSELILFSTDHATQHRIIEKILSAEQFSENFQDYAAGMDPLPGQDHAIAVYFDSKGESPLHWHLRPTEKEKVLSAVREMAGSVSYDEGGISVIMVPKTAIDNLRLRLRAIRVDLSEFGGVGQAGSVYSDAPVAISIVWG